MDKPYEVDWTERSLRNALKIKNYLIAEFSLLAVSNFETLLKEFELTFRIFQPYIPNRELKSI